MKFRDRAHAGRLLAEKLIDYESENPIVLAIPRGGVEVGIEVAKRLNCDFELLIVRKLPFPDNPESGFGAIAEDGSSVVFDRFAQTVSETERQQIYEAQQQEIQSRIRTLRKGRPLPAIKGRTVILIDDGIAMGSTMQASVAMCRNQKAQKIIVAAPVSSPRTKIEFQSLADDAVILTTPEFFQAVAQVYENWYDVSDEEVLELLDSFN
ncbi:MAG: phosphoribosyltransferase [Desulfobacterales bacterium]|nr:phosphoribosyltransferase [Desulfobacterales bacterium]